LAWQVIERLWEHTTAGAGISSHDWRPLETVETAPEPYGRGHPSDRFSGGKNLVPCNLLPVSYVAPVELRELRQRLRYRNLVVAQAVRKKNKMSGLLMEVGAEYNKKRPPDRLISFDARRSASEKQDHKAFICRQEGEVNQRAATEVNGVSASSTRADGGVVTHT
jgi:hypothetical protein